MPYERKGDRHKDKAVGWRLVGELVERVRAYAAKTGRPQAAVVSDAITEYLDRHEPGEPEGEQ